MNSTVGFEFALYFDRFDILVWFESIAMCEFMWSYYSEDFKVLVIIEKKRSILKVNVSYLKGGDVVYASYHDNAYPMSTYDHTMPRKLSHVCTMLKNNY